jgi:small subunit ribosomal protein S17
MADQTTTTQPAPTAETAGAGARGVRKEVVGEVISSKMNKTLVVRVDRRVPHPRYGKIITKSTKFYAHDEENKAKAGDRVRIVETRPLSTLTRWRLVEVLPQTRRSAAAVVEGS